MNYSNMIEEKNLKKTFIVATLISTIIGTFTTGLGLYERVGQKRKQQKTDRGQDDQIKALEAKVKANEEREKNENQKQIEGGRNQRQIEGPRDEYIERSLGGSGQLIKREYDRDVQRFGERFAQGDHITENQLQGQIITLQGTVIHLLEDALYTGRIADPIKLYNASELAREGSLSALQQQYQRMMQQAPIRRPNQPVRRISSQPSLASHKSKALPPASTRGPPASTRGGNDESMSLVKKSKTVVDADGPLFCIYSEDLQHDNKMSLHDAFGKGGGNQCPACRTTLEVEQGRAWKITKDVVHKRIETKEYDEEIMEERTYLIGNRFVVKSHRENGGFACILCARGRDKDTLLESPQGLVRHIWQKHDPQEYNDVDIKEVGALEACDHPWWDGSCPELSTPSALDSIKRAFACMAGQHTPKRSQALKSCMKRKRRKGIGHDGMNGHKVRKRVRFDATADSAWRGAI